MVWAPGQWRAVLVARRGHVRWSVLLLVLLATPRPSCGFHEGIESEASSKVEPLLPYYPDGDNKHVIRHAVRQEQDGDSQTTDFIESASGSGDSTVNYPTTYIEISLKISLDEYVKQQDEINGGILGVLQTYLSTDTAATAVRRSTATTAVRRSTATRRSASEEQGIHLSLDMEKSSNDVSVLQVVLVDSDTGEQNITATTHLYNKLASEPAKFIQDLENAIGIQVVDVQFIHEESSDGPKLQSTSLKWWDILLITLGCLAVALGPVLLVLACCLRWFSRRREAEEKEGLLTQDALDAAEHRQEQLSTSNGGDTGLRERRERDREHERRDHVRRVARVGFQSRVQIQSHPLTPEEIDNLLQNPATLRSEYSSISSNLVTMAEVPPGAKEKNRYKDILPNPQTRVSLFLKFAVSNSDYINANYIRGFHDAGRTYIATQGPLPWTVDDFWRMIWEQKSSVVVMVTGLEERRIVKCSRYWPDSQVALTASYGDLDVTLKKRVTSNPSYTVSHFHVRHREKLVSRDITHFWFTAWPDHGVPTSTQPALDFLTHVRRYTQEIPAPIVVHCSAGIGRTGVFIGADIGITQLEAEGQVDILKIVSTMRQDRGGMVQTEKQYIFLHQLLLSYAHQQLKQQRATGRGETHQTTPSTGNSTPDLVLQNNFTEVV